jgi:hypothetical protein
VEFLYHYYFGNGKPVLLRDMGLLDAVQQLADSSPNGGAFRFGEQIAQTASRITKPYNGTFTDSFNRSYDFGNILWVMGGGVLTGAFRGTIISKSIDSNSIGTYSYSGDAGITFTDVFTDPLGIIQTLYGTSDSPNAPSWLKAAAEVGGTEFGYYDTWTKQYAGGGTYE